MKSAAQDRPGGPEPEHAEHPAKSPVAGEPGGAATSPGSTSAGCVCGQRDADREPDATDHVIVPTAADCPVHGSSAACVCGWPEKECLRRQEASSAARIPPGIKGVNVVQEKAPVDGVPEPGGLPAASSAAQTWLVQVFSFHADYIARDGGVRLPSGWEPLRIEATGGNKYRVSARKQEVAT